jgi:hypothetical protein
MAFLTHYQLPIRYETRTEILSSFKQSSSTHIFDHIHEWGRRRRLIKVPLPNQLLVDWFTKSLIGPITRDVSTGGVVTKDKAISHAQYLDLVYSQMGTLYDLILNSPCPSMNPTLTPPVAFHVVDDVIGTFCAETRSKKSNHSNPKSTTPNVQNNPPSTPSSGKTSELNSVQSTPTGKNQNKKKGKGKNKKEKNNNQQYEKPKTWPFDDKDKRKPCYPCLICGEDHYMKDCPRRVEVTKFLQGTGTPPTSAILSQPFPSQQQAQLVIHDQPSPSTMSYVLMCIGDSMKNEVAVATRAKDYSPSKEKVDDSPPLLVQPPPPTSPPNGPLHLKRPSLDTFLHPPPKGVVRKSSFNCHACSALNYSIVEDLAHAPSVMSALEVLQSCPAQRKALLKSIGGIDPTDTNLIIFDLEDHIPRIPPQLSFQIQVFVENKNICRTVINEGASTCVMLVTCWKAIGSPSLTESHNTLKDFNGTGIKPYGVLASLSITLEGKEVNVEVEVFDAPLDYNLLLGRSWIDSMRAVVSTLFRVLHFLHQGKFIIVDQLAFLNSYSRTSNVPFISKTPPNYENVGVGLLKDSTLMGTFPIPPPNIPYHFFSSINMISTNVSETPKSYDPWIVPISDYCLHYGD